MNSFYKAGVAMAAAAITAVSSMPAATAGGLYDGRGSMKDAPQVYGHTSAHRCYLRGDVGYSHSTDPNAQFDSPNYASVNPSNPLTFNASNEEINGAWMGEIGIGCGSGSRGFRGDLTLGYRGERDVTGNKPDIPGIHFPGTFESKLSTLTAMANVYYDFGVVRGFVPYVGAGIGIARHDFGTVSVNFASPPATNPVETFGGSTETSFAWSLMAGVGYQISDRAVLDFGYRYIDLGDVSTRGNICNTCAAGGGSQDRLSIDDITAHEFKIGLRYHFGGSTQQSYK